MGSKNIYGRVLEGRRLSGKSGDAWLYFRDEEVEMLREGKQGVWDTWRQQWGQWAPSSSGLG